jgi:hypothetical protein
VNSDYAPPSDQTGTNEPTFIQFPAEGRPQWGNTQQSNHNVDTVHGVDYQWTAGIDQRKDRVDACGTPIDSWRVDILDPSQVNHTSNSAMDFKISGWYDVATQYGGLLVAQHVVTTMLDGSLTITRDLTIDSATSPDPLPAG